MNNKRLLIFIIPISLIAIVAIVALLNLAFKKGLVLSTPFAANIAYSQPIDNKTLYYFSGSSFVSYDLEARKSQALTPQYELPTNIRDIQWSKNAALVQADGYSPSDMLYTQVVQKQLDPNNTYWWLFNFTDDTYSLIGDPATKAEVRNAVWQKDDTYVYTEKQSSNSLAVIRNENGNLTKIIELNIYDILEGATADTLLYLSSTSDNLNMVTIGSKQVATISGQVINVLTTGPDGSCLFLTKAATSTESDLPRGGLQFYSAKDNKTQTLKSDFSGNAVWLADNDLWLAVGYTEANQVQVVANPQGKVTSFDLRDEREQNEKHYLRAAAITGSNYLLTDSTNDLFYASNKAVEGLLSPPNTDQLKEGVGETAFSMVYDSAKQYFAVYIMRAPYQDTKQLVLNYLNKYGYDPNQIPLHWYAGDGITTGFELPPSVTPIEAPDTDDIIPSYGGD